MINYYSPERVNNTTFETSYWNSIRQPYVFKFYRRDAEYFNFYQQSGKIILQCNSVSMGGYLPIVGEIISVIDDNTKKRRVGTITQVISATAAGQPQDIFKTDIDFDNSVFTGSGYINWQRRENYQIKMQLTAYIPAIDDIVYLGEAVGTPDLMGVAKIDVRELLTYQMQKINKFKYSTTNQREYSGWCYFTFTYSDYFVFNGFVSATTRDAGGKGKWWGIDGVKYLLDEYGQNFAEYVPSANVEDAAKFLTAFDTPTMFLGYPFSLSFIYPEDFKTISAYRKQRELNSVGGTIGTLSHVLNANEAGGVNQLLIEGMWNSNTTQLDVYIQNAGGDAQQFMVTGYVVANYVYSAPAAPITAINFTEEKRVLIDKECKQYPIYLMWKNSLGGWDYWLFDKNNETSFESSQAGSYNVYVEDIEFSNLREKITEARQFKRVTMGDVVTKESLKGLQEIERSPQVYVLYNANKLSEYPEQAWMGVRLAPKGFKYNANQTGVEVEVTIIYPEFYSVSN